MLHKKTRTFRKCGNFLRYAEAYYSNETESQLFQFYLISNRILCDSFFYLPVIDIEKCRFAIPDLVIDKVRKYLDAIYIAD